MKITKKEKKKNGFTLIELLAVLVVLAVLGGVIVVNMQSSAKSARQAACRFDWRTVRAAGSAYYNDTNADATSIGDLAKYGYLSDPGQAIQTKGYLDRTNYRIYFSSGSIGVQVNFSTPVIYADNVEDCKNVN